MNMAIEVARSVRMQVFGKQVLYLLPRGFEVGLVFQFLQIACVHELPNLPSAHFESFKQGQHLVSPFFKLSGFHGFLLPLIT